MKQFTLRIGVVLVLLLTSAKLSAQYEFEIGYRTGMWTGADRINRIIDQYNTDRPWLEKQMPHFNTGRGIRFATGKAPTKDSPLGLVFDLTFLRSTGTA